VNRLGLLPLAVKLAGAQLRSESAASWLAAFDARKLISKRPEDVSDSLPDSLGLSLKALPSDARELYALLAIFRPGEPIQLRAIERLWAALKGLRPQDTLRLLDDLESRALVEIDESPAAYTVELHDLLRDLLFAELGEERRADAHRALLAAYGCSDGWRAAEDDGYLYDHLVYHLDSLGAVKEIETLFADPGWMQARVRQSGYQYESYLADLDLAWKSAFGRVSEDDRSLAACARYALIRSSIHSIAGNYAPAAVARAVETGVWPAERALRVAARVPDAEARIKMFIALLGVDRLDPNQRLQAEDLALSASQSDRGRMLPELARVIDPSRIPRAFEIALSLEDSRNLADALNGLAPLLNAEMTSRALERARQLPEEWAQAELLAALGPRVPSNWIIPVLADGFEVRTKRPVP
jgi:hypothetical protein